MQIQDVQNFFFYAGIVLAVVVGLFILLQVLDMAELANRIGLIGIIAGFAFSVTGLIMKKFVDGARRASWKRT